MFARKHRLSKTKDVLAVFAGGRAFFNSFLSLKVLRKTQSAPRITVVVSTKVSKSAVKRNRLKRIVREFLRKKTDLLLGADYVVILKPASAKAVEAEIVKNLDKLLVINKLLK